MLTENEIREMGRKLREVTGGDCDLTDAEIAQAMSLADSLSEKGAPGVGVKAKNFSGTLAEILGPALAKAAAAGLVTVEDGGKTAPKTVDNLAAQGVARQRAAAADAWRRKLSQRAGYSHFLGGPEDMALRKKSLGKMSPAQRRTELQGSLAAARRAAFAGFVTE